MRIWDVPVSQLCDKHLLSEHRELHGIWNILTLNKKGYSRHPETLRWAGRLKALYKRHKEEAEEMRRRGFGHLTGLDENLAVGQGSQTELLNSIEEQKEILRNKKCRCNP